MKKSEDFVFLVKVVKNCHISGQVHWLYKSERFAINLASGSFHNVAIQIGTAVADIKTLINGNNIDYGHYLFKISGNIEGQPATKTSSFGYIEVTSTNLVANIIGARQASQGKNETLILNGSLGQESTLGSSSRGFVEEITRDSRITSQRFLTCFLNPDQQVC